MGRPMALNLHKAGFDVVVYNRTRAKAIELESLGIRVADSPKKLAGQVDIVLSCLADVAASREVFLGPHGIATALRPGQIVVDHATVDLETTRLVHGAVGKKGASFLDAPVSGGPVGAAEGTLSIMVGGGEEAFRLARPVFLAMGKTVVRMGECGAGTAAKLANQLLVGAHTLASCEALLLAREAGVDLERLAHLLKRSWGQSRMLERNAPNILEGRFGPSPVPLRNLLKDLSIVTRLARELGIRVPAAGAAHSVFARLAAEGRGEWDITAACTALKDEAGDTASD